MSQPNVIDEAIYLAVDHQAHDHYVLVTGLAITRNPDRFTPIAPLHGVGAHTAPDQ
jgi:hypothetical protein